MQFHEDMPIAERGTPPSAAPRNGSRPKDHFSAAEASGGDNAETVEPFASPHVAADQQNGHRTFPRRPGKANSHLKQVPQDFHLCEQIRTAAEAMSDDLPPNRSVSKLKLARRGGALLKRMGLPEDYLGFTMVLIGNANWRDQFLATPYERRLLLLPTDIAHHPDCVAAVPPNGDRSTGCLACAFECIQARAHQLGYQVLLAERSSTVLQSIVEGSIDGILGVARMDVLEKAIDKVLIAGVPSYVIPLDSTLDDETPQVQHTNWSIERLKAMLESSAPQTQPPTENYLPLMRAANRLFTAQFDRLLPRSRSTTPGAAASPLGVTEEIAFDWLANGGKRFRPFITLAAFNAAANLEGAKPATDAVNLGPFPDSVCRVAMAIEAFHKASLVHDDIQDDDQFRYGRETLHRSQGIGPAINIGDYLIGLGYRLVNSCASDLGADVAADIVRSMSEAHIKLCDGQGAEMAWQLDPDWSIQPADAQQIYKLKTSPAFEAALYAGLRMAGPVEQYTELVPAFAEHLGVGFQVINDLLDWQGDADNKLLAGQDALAIRPTMLLALALHAASPSQRAELRKIYQAQGDDELRLHQLRKLFVELGAFDRANEMVDHSRVAALDLAERANPPAFGQFLRFLVDTVLSYDHASLGTDIDQTLTTMQTSPE